MNESEDRELMVPTIAGSDTEPFVLGVRHSFFNQTLRELRQRNGWTQADVAQRLGFSFQVYRSFETLRIWPSNDRIQAIAALFGVEPETIFPAWLRQYREYLRPVTTQVGVTEELISERMRRHLPEPTYEIDDDDLDQYFLRHALVEAMSQLSERERTILAYRFGFDGGTKKTLEETSQIVGSTGEYIRQVQQHAITKLRRRISSGPLRPYDEWPLSTKVGQEKKAQEESPWVWNKEKRTYERRPVATEVSKDLALPSGG